MILTKLRWNYLFMLLSVKKEHFKKKTALADTLHFATVFFLVCCVNFAKVATDNNILKHCESVTMADLFNNVMFFIVLHCISFAEDSYCNLQRHYKLTQHEILPESKN